MKNRVAKGDSILLFTKNEKFILVAQEKMIELKGLGVVNGKKFVGKEYGAEVTLGNKKYTILQPAILDKLETIRRKAQIILPKDSALIGLYCNLKSGDKVIEGGSGSGALTIVLAHLVQPNGRVISYELREDFRKVAEANIINANLQRYVKFKLKDITKGIDEKNVDSMILDIPNPWDAVRNAFNVLKIGGHFASYSPTINQVEKTVKALRKYPFANIKTIENLQREIVVGERGTRPAFEMLGHTGYMTFARKISKALKLK